jgi:drug/metabolite transporter (DMT)-like permease
MKTKNIKGIVFLLLSALLYSSMPVMIRLLGGSGMPPMSQVFLRYIFAFIAAVVYFTGFQKTKFKVDKKDWGLFAVATIFCYALTNLFFTYGILNTLVSNALFLFYTYAIITPILGFFLIKEKLNKFNIVALILSFAALLLLFQPNALPTWKIGGIFALLAALGQSLYVIIRRKLGSYSAGIMMLGNTFVGVIILGAMALVFENSFYKTTIFTLSINTWVTTILFGIANFLAWFFMTKGFELFKATAGSLILLTELVFGVVLALIFFSEVPTLLTLVGGGLILISSVLVIMKGK